MGIETFPEIENFQKLPRQVIVKGGTSSYDREKGARLRGIVINNIGQPIRDIRVNVVIFDKKKMPVLSTSVVTEPVNLPQGAIGTFTVEVSDHPEQIADYHLFANWRFDDEKP